MEKIHIILTGGTIDSYYEITKDTVVPFEKSQLPKYFEDFKPYADFKFTEVCMKDSRDLAQNDIIKIKDIIDNSPCSRFIITHGTYTMPDTARFLKSNLKSKDKTIVLTGSMTPLMGFAPSDAGFNMGFAMASVQNLPAGIYVCMNAKVFSPEEVTKLLDEGRFSSIFLEKRN